MNLSSDRARDDLGRIEAHGITKIFPGMSRPALDGVSLVVDPGEMVDIMGPSGSGKSTLLTVLNGLEIADQGVVRISGQDVTTIPAASRPTATLFQQDNLCGRLTVYDNVAYPLRVSGVSDIHVRDQTDVTLLRLGLIGLERALPHQLSGGQRRRVALARAMVSRPQVLLLDEPLTGLEPGLQASLLDLIGELRRRLGTTVVHVTHEPSLALATADRILVLNRGQVVGAGTPRHMYQRPASAFVANFLGRASFLDARVIGPAPSDARKIARVHVSVLETLLTVPTAPGVNLSPGTLATLMVRPNSLQITPLPVDDDLQVREPHGLIGIVRRALYTGETMEYIVETEQGSVAGTGDIWGRPLAPSEPVSLHFEEPHLWLLP